MTIDMKYYMVVFNEDGRSVSPLLPIRADQVERTLGTLEPPTGYLQIDKEGLELANEGERAIGQELNVPPLEVEKPFKINKPLDLSSIHNRKALNTVWVEVPSDIALKYMSQNRGITYTDQMFIRIKLANPDRYLESLALYFQSRNLNVGAKDNYILISIPNFVEYQGVLELADILANWFEEQNLTVVRNRIDLYAVESGEMAVGTIVYLSSTNIRPNHCFFQDYLAELSNITDEEGNDDNNAHSSP